MGNTIRHPGGLIPEPGFKAKRDKAGLWSGRQLYHCKERELIDLLPQKGSPHPKISFITVEAVEIEIVKEGLCRVVADYAGLAFGGGAGDEEDEFFLDISTSEEPIETHHRYEDLDAQDVLEAVELAKNPPRSADGKKVVEPDQTGWTGEKTELYEDLRKGLEAYREPRVTWTKRWISRSKPDGLNKIGEIEEPDGDVPAAAAGRDWLNIGIRSRQRGKVFENEKSWELSGRGGWNERYYGE